VPTQLTPVTLRVLQPDLIAVPATDGLVHVAYAAQMTNIAPDAAVIGGMVPTNALQGFEPTGTNSVIDMDGKDVTGMVLPFKPELVDGVTPAQASYTRELQGGASGIAFFDVRYQRMEDVPSLFSHRLSVTVSGGGSAVTGDVDPIAVGCRQPVVISPPLVGSGWWNANGCCETITLHRRATLPINGDIRPPEQFAIDYEQLNAQGGCCTGPVKDLSSWPFFGAPILAVADGVVVDMLDGMPEQVPGPPKDVTAQNAPGNYVIQDIGGGNYVLYAHLHTGSIPYYVRPGAKLSRGRRLGALGNTGSSTAPHLHFQVMDRPSALDAIGLPFVFDQQVLEGRVIGTTNEADAQYEGGGTLQVEHNAPVTLANQMPAQGQVFGYHLK
jgi:hypothetical protein